MKRTDIQPGRMYRGLSGETREVLGTLDSRRRKGKADSVRFRIVGETDAPAEERVVTAKWFAEWASEEISAETLAEEAEQAGFDDPTRIPVGSLDPAVTVPTDSEGAE